MARWGNSLLNGCDVIGQLISGVIFWAGNRNVRKNWNVACNRTTLMFPLTTEIILPRVNNIIGATLYAFLISEQLEYYVSQCYGIPMRTKQ